MTTRHQLDPRSRRRILVVANETVNGVALRQAICRSAAAGDGEVLVVAPVRASRLRRWVSDQDPALQVARERLRTCVARLALQGVTARGQVGDGDPLQAIADALRRFAADEIIIATHPAERSHWLARDLVRRIRDRFGLPTLHIVVDTTADEPYVVPRRALRAA